MAGGLWVCRVRPSGLVAVTVPSGCRAMPQPHRWIAIKWWKEHRLIRLVRLVGPPWDAGDDVVRLACRGGLGAAGEPAVPVPDGDRPAQVHRDGVGDRADVQRQADRRDQVIGQPGPQVAGEPAGPGQQADGPGDDELPGGPLGPQPPPAAGDQPRPGRAAGPGRADPEPCWPATGLAGAALAGLAAEQLGGELAQELVVEVAGDDRDDRRVTVRAGPGRRPRRRPRRLRTAGRRCSGRGADPALICTWIWAGCPARSGTPPAAISRRHVSSSAS